MLIDMVVVSRFKSNLLDKLANKIGDIHTFLPAIALRPGLLACNLDSCLQLFWIVSQDLGADTILQRSDYLSARGVVFRVCRKHQHHVERQTHRVTLNLHVALLHDIEETNLNLPGQIGQLIDCKNASVRPWQQTVVDCQFIAQQVAAFCGFDRIDITDDVSDSHIGSGELFYKARIAIDPIDGCHIAVEFYGLAPKGGDRFERIVVNFRAGDDGNPFVQQFG